MLSYRRTNKDDPMSDYGFAMFSDNKDDIEGYGKNLYTVNISDCIKVESLTDKIISTWITCIESDFYGFNSDPSDYSHLSIDEIISALNPQNIVDSAGGYDSSLANWLYEMVLEDLEIYAIKTHDGAIVFEKSLISKI